MDWLPRDELLTYEEIARVARVCVERFGLRGDPAHRRRAARPGPRHPARRDARAARRRPRDDHQRREARPSSRTTSRPPGCDASTSRSTRLQRERFLALTRRDELDRVLAGIDAALDAGLAPVKVNAVVMRGVNDDEVVDLARFGRERASACASSSSCRSTRKASGATTRSCPRTRSSSASTRCSRSSTRSTSTATTSSPRRGSRTATASATSA